MEHIFLNLNSNSKYFTWYSAICQRAANRSLPAGVYTELHHILPKSLFPKYEKDKTNLVKLTAREHFICHWLLTKIINDPKIVYAFQMMIPNKTSHRYSPKSSIVYELLKKKFSKNNQGTKGNRWVTNGIENLMISIDSEIPSGYYLGRTFSNKHKTALTGIPKTDEQKKKQSLAMLGKPGRTGESNPATRPDVKEKIRNARLGTTASNETKLKMRLAKLGKKRGPYKLSRP